MLQSRSYCRLHFCSSYFCSYCHFKMYLTLIVVTYEICLNGGRNEFVFIPAASNLTLVQWLSTDKFGSGSSKYFCGSTGSGSLTPFFSPLFLSLSLIVVLTCSCAGFFRLRGLEFWYKSYWSIFFSGKPYLCTLEMMLRFLFAWY